jgi:hypothetical protein
MAGPRRRSAATFPQAPAWGNAEVPDNGDDAARTRCSRLGRRTRPGIAGSGVFLNYAVWESTVHFKRAFTNPEFDAKLARYPGSAVVSPHLFRKVSVPGICGAD